MPPKTRRRVVAIATGAALVVLIVIAIEIRNPPRVDKIALLVGAVITRNTDPHLQVPIRNAKITAQSGTAGGATVSESSGLFRLKLDPAVTSADMVQLRVEHPDYQPLTITTPATNQIYVLRLTPTARQADVSPATPQTRLTGIRVRYATRSTSTTTVGTAVRTFDIVNKGNVPCERKQPCSPDGRWKATIGSLSLDTEDPNKQFRNVRVSCIAGPCPFSSIELDRFSRGGRHIMASVRNWSDPVTYLLEAEVVQTTDSELIRYTYPVTFGRSMNFTLPAVAVGPSIEADLNGSEIVFPLGPELHLSWATCRLEVASDGTRQYRCELNPGYTFD